QGKIPAFARMTAAGLCLSLAGCFLSEEKKTAGGEDFPNTINQSVASFMDESSGWNKMDSVSRPLPTVQIDGADIVSPGGSAPLTKKTQSTVDDSLILDSVVTDTAGDTVWTFIWKSNSQAAVRETVVVLFDDNYLDDDPANDNAVTAYGNVYNSLSGEILSSYRYRDADGDSLLTVISGGTNLAEFTEILYLGIYQTTNITIITPGEDLSFATAEDNITASVKSVTTGLLGDTTYYAEALDADGDSVLHPSAGRAQNLARHTSIIYLPDSKVIQETLVEAGPDLDFGEANNEATLDNLILSLKITYMRRHNGHVLEISEWMDADGDSIITPVPGRQQNLALYRKTTDPAWVLYDKLIEEILVDAGPDLDFDQEADNRIIYLKSVTLNEPADTLEFMEATTPDGEGYGYDSSSSDSFVVDLQVYKKGSLLTPLTQSDKGFLRMLAFPSDSSKNYMLKFYGEKTWVTGASDVLRITGNNPDSTINPADTVDVVFESYSADDDTLAFKLISFKIGLGNDPAAADDDALYAFRIMITNRFSPERYIDFTFTSDSPISADSEPVSGRIDVIWEYDSGASLTVQAVLSPDGLEAEYTDTNSGSGTIRWDKDGKLLEWNER
ncbi:hypothetical protein ACFL5V_13685, partial [Fibrobacterota bacterium]